MSLFFIKLKTIQLYKSSIYIYIYVPSNKKKLIFVPNELIYVENKESNINKS